MLDFSFKITANSIDILDINTQLHPHFHLLVLLNKSCLEGGLLLVHAPGLLFSCFTLLFIITVLGRGESPGGKRVPPRPNSNLKSPRFPAL